MTRAAVGLGSNLGNRQSYLSLAVAHLAEVGRIVTGSSLYETEPVGPVKQGPFLNAVVVLDTDLSADALLAAMGEIEGEAGRVRRIAQGPRTLDLDLLIYGWEEISTESLIVPHPQLTRRRFVLEPLVEAWPGVIVPGLGPAQGFIDDVSEQVVVKLTGWSGWSQIP